MHPLPPEDYRALAEFRYRIRQFLHTSEQLALKAGIEPQQHQLLLALKAWPEGREASVSDLAGRLLVCHHTAVGLIDRAEGHGWVACARDEKDKRRVLIRLTEQGETLLQALSRCHRQELHASGPYLIQALETLLASHGAEAMEEKQP